MRTMSKRALWREPPTGESVIVTDGGEIIGTFIPVAVTLPEALEGVHAAPAQAAQRMTQADRDAVLRKVRGGRTA